MASVSATLVRDIVTLGLPCRALRGLHLGFSSPKGKLQTGGLAEDVNDTPGIPTAPLSEAQASASRERCRLRRFAVGNVPYGDVHTYVLSLTAQANHDGVRSCARACKRVTG